MKRYLLVAVLLAAPAAWAQAVDAGKADPFTGGSAEAGAGKAAVCGACHGPAGNSSNPEWPKLAGQHSAYTFHELVELKSGARKSPVMGPLAAALSEQDMRDLAAYFAAQQASPGVASPDSIEVAQPLYRAGDVARGLPACAACHGPQGAGNAAARYPRIGGQHARYNAMMLRAYRDQASSADTDTDTDADAAIMASIAAKLTDAEIQALASYLNGLQ